MIITGNSIGFSLDLVTRLLDDVSENTRVEALEFRHVAVWEVKEALSDMQLLASGTMGRKGLYHAKIRPAPEYSLTREQWFHAADVLEQELGYDDLPRVLMLHEQGERAHLHVIWGRTDIDTMTLRPDSFTYAKHERAARALEAAFGHEAVPSRREPDPDGQSGPDGQSEPDGREGAS